MCNKIQKMKKTKTAFVLFKFNYKSINKINDKSKKDKNEKKKQSIRCNIKMNLQQWVTEHQQEEEQQQEQKKAS